MKQKRFKDVADLLKTEIPKLGNLREELIKEYSLLIEVYLKLGDDKNAIKTFAQYSTLRDQLEADERSNRKMSFESEQKIADDKSTITNLQTEKQDTTRTQNYHDGIFVVIVSLLLLIALFIYNLLRVKRNANVTLEEKNKIISLEKANVEKEKANVEKEKKRSDILLLNILPKEVAEELMETGKAVAKRFDEVSVLFTDFLGFTAMSEKMSAEDLVAELDYCFSSFDIIALKFGLEKIKTIGDSYMAVAGLPLVSEENAVDAVRAAIAINKFMKRYQKERISKGMKYFQVRIGIHSGPVVAGIVGMNKFAYDIWGDTVNIASLMESSGEVGKVNISGSTYEFVKNDFECIHRGKIQAKGKGEVDMYFVEGKYKTKRI